MSQVQAWIAAVGVVAGLGVGVAGAGWHWGRRLSAVQRMADHLAASRNLLDQQNTQARRQVEQLQTELAELRLFADRARRKFALLAEQASAPAPVQVQVPPPPPAPPRASAQEVAQMLQRNDQRRQPAIARADQDDAGFEPTQVDPPDPL